MKWIQIFAMLMTILGLGIQVAQAQTYAGPSPFSLTYFEFYGTPIEPLDYAQLTTDALGFDVLGEYNPSYYASVGLDYEKVRFLDIFNTTVSFLGVEARVFAAPNGESPFAPYVYGGAGLGLNVGTGNELKAGLGTRIQVFSPIFFDFSAGSNWLDSGLQYLSFKGGLSASFDLPKVAQNPMAPSSQQPATAPLNSAPQATAIPTSTATIILVSPTQTPTLTPTLEETSTNTPTWTATATVCVSISTTSTPMPVLPESKVKGYYHAGIKAFNHHYYKTAMRDFKKVLRVDDPLIPSYFYAESNSMIGVIYEFYSKKIKRHDHLAIFYYKRALKIDPRTKSARKYLTKLEKPKKRRKKSVLVKQATVDVSSPQASTQEPVVTPVTSD